MSGPPNAGHVVFDQTGFILQSGQGRGRADGEEVDDAVPFELTDTAGQFGREVNDVVVALGRDFDLKTTTHTSRW